MNITLKQLAEITQGELQGDASLTVTGAAGLLDAAPQDVAFLGNPKYVDQVGKSRAGCVFLPLNAKGTSLAEAVKNRIFVDDPQWAFAQVLGVLENSRRQGHLAPVPHPTAHVHAHARLARDVDVGPFAVIERLASVGEGTTIGAQCYLGPEVHVGKGCKIYPQVVIRERCKIGDRVILHSGTVVGADGFGFSTDKKTGAHRKIPQIGNVEIEDDVEIGANVTIDRATVGTTRIGAGTKIDNLVQIAHNVQIGKNCLIVSQVGISGSTKIGNQVILAGQAGIVGHLTIGDGAVITAQSGVINDVEPKAVLFGSPARPHREGMKIQALLGKLPEIYEAIKSWKASHENTKLGSKDHVQR